MELSISDNIYFVDNEEREKVLDKLESDFNELKAQANKLKSNPNSSEYKRVKRKLLRVFNQKDRILRGW